MTWSLYWKPLKDWNASSAYCRHDGFSFACISNAICISNPLFFLDDLRYVDYLQIQLLELRCVIIFFKKAPQALESCFSCIWLIL